MKILVVSHCQVIPEYQADLQAMAKLGDEIVLVTPDLYKEGGRPTEASTLPGQFSHYKLKTVFGKSGKQHFHFYLNMIKIIKLIKRFKPDIIYLYEEPNSLVTIQWLMISRLINESSKLVIWTACNTKRNYKDMFHMLDIRRWLFDVNIKISERLSDGIVAISRDASEVLIWKGWKKTIYISPTHFVDPNKFKPSSKKNQIFRLGVIGRLQYQKGFDLVIDALSDFNKPFVLDIYGEGEEKQSLLDLANKNGISANCNWHGNVAYKDIPKYISELDVLIVPSREVGHLKEQFGRVVIEAMCSGVNVIVSDSGYLPKIAGEFGEVFKQNSVDSLAEKIKFYSIESNRIEAEKIREHTINAFSAEATAERLRRIFRKVVNSKQESQIVTIYDEK
ncbi:glycosyltransferase [Vibrio ponticus]|uniref:Glycosyltransferase n=1 Tax=Vibrio ponticus TaxID=265668 RepID=A0A3N3DYD7_9VIBR|nr:glycosyltransferase family 4 protein [Vibrio ponticus]ROV59380.1 glycosyltransferase [Vibrio ponticus]